MSRLKLVTSPCFLLAIALLGANDFLFKPLFHNWLTGKVSDFAGLFAFALFLIAIVPRFPWAMVCLSGFGFVVWKSELAQPADRLVESLEPSANLESSGSNRPSRSPCTAVFRCLYVTLPFASAP